MEISMFIDLSHRRYTTTELQINPFWATVWRFPDKWIDFFKRIRHFISICNRSRSTLHTHNVLVIFTSVLTQKLKTQQHFTLNLFTVSVALLKSLPGWISSSDECFSFKSANGGMAWDFFEGCSCSSLLKLHLLQEKEAVCRHDPAWRQKCGTRGERELPIKEKAHF